MLRRRILTIFACAAGSFVLTMFFISTPRLDATDAVQVTQLMGPQLVSGGVELTMKYDGRPGTVEPVLIKPGKLQPLQLTAKNVTDRSAEVTATIAISATEPQSPLSRRMPASTEVWKQEQIVTLSPRESRTIQLAPDLTIAAGSHITVSISCGDQSVWAFRLSGEVSAEDMKKLLG